MPGFHLEIDPQKRPHSLYEGVEYKEFWAESQRDKLDRLEHAIVRDLLPVSGRRIVDVGCGYGRLADCYLGRFQQVVLADGSMSLLRQAVERTGGKATYVACDVTRLPFRPAAFDTVLLVRVFHHVEDSRALLSESRRILGGEGRFIFTYCNKRNAGRVGRWLVRKGIDNPFTEKITGVGSEVMGHHPSVVHRLLLETGYANMRYYGVGVVDKIAGRLGPLGRRLPPGRRLARFLGSTKIAPWIFCGAEAVGSAGLLDAGGIAELLQCPACGGDLSGDERGYICLKCGRRYPVEDGIIDFRIG